MNKCFLCDIQDDYEHYFINCKSVEILWITITNILIELNFNKNLRNLKYIVFGYKISHEEYNDINVVISIIGFTIYKHFHLSNQRRDFINIKLLFKNEIRKKLQLTGYQKYKILNNIYEKL